jgi:hypothetical protein
LLNLLILREKNLIQLLRMRLVEMGLQHHLTMEMLKGRAEIDLLHVPYKGGVEATTATIEPVRV